MTTAFDAPHDEIEGRYWSLTRVALALVVLAMVAMWIWIYVWAPRDNPDRLGTRSFAEAAEQICAPFAAQLGDLPPTTTETTIGQRAELVADGTAITAAMVAALGTEAERVTDPDDLRLLELWFADWDAYVSDREAYLVRLRSAPAGADRADYPFTLTERASGGFYTRTIDGFAAVNDMSSCSVPGDI